MRHATPTDRDGLATRSRAGSDDRHLRSIPHRAPVKLVLLLLGRGDLREALLLKEICPADVLRGSPVRGDVLRQLLDREQVARKLVVPDDAPVPEPVVLDELPARRDGGTRTPCSGCDRNGGRGGGGERPLGEHGAR